MLLLFILITHWAVFVPAVPAQNLRDLDNQLEDLQKKPLLDEILMKMDEKYKVIQSLKIRFEQTKNLMLLAQPVQSEGELIFQRPDMLLWKFQNPDPTVMVLKDAKLTIHYPDLNQADIFDIKKYQDRVAKYLGFTDSMMKLKKYYEIRVVEEGQDVYLLELLPKRRRVKQKIEVLKVWLDTESYLPVRIYYREPNQDTTFVKILNTEVNIPLEADTFDYELPEGTKIQYPMKQKDK